MSQKLSALLVALGLAWGLMLLRYTAQQPRHQSSAELRQEILELSRRYVKVLTEENQLVPGGPQGTSMAGYGELGSYLQKMDLLLGLFYYVGAFYRPGKLVKGWRILTLVIGQVKINQGQTPKRVWSLEPGRLPTRRPPGAPPSPGHRSLSKTFFNPGQLFESGVW